MRAKREMDIKRIVLIIEIHKENAGPNTFLMTQ